MLKDDVLSAFDTLSGLFDGWRQHEDVMRVFTRPEKREDGFTRRDEPVQPSDTFEIFVPFTFSNTEKFLAHQHGIFFADAAIHKYTSDGTSEDMISAALHEAVAAKQDSNFGSLLALDGQMRDAWGYGLGVASHMWESEYADVPVEMTVDIVTQALVRGMRGESIDLNTLVRDIEEGQVVNEGTRTRNISPWNVIIDPNVTINNMHECEFAGWVNRDANALRLLRIEKDKEQRRFNGMAVKMLCEKGGGKSGFYDRYDNDNERVQKNVQSQVRKGRKGQSYNYDEVVLFRYIIPRDHGLSNRDRPEWWIFYLAGDEIITGCSPLGYRHNRIPMTFAACNNDVHELVPTSHSMITFGYQQYMNIKANADKVNTLKNVYGTILVNSAKVDMESVLAGGIGGVWTATEAAYDDDMRQLIHQLPPNNHTQNFTRDIMELGEAGKDGNGVNDAANGDLSKAPERPGQAGINLIASGNSRMDRISRILDRQMFIPRGYQVAWNNTQFLSQKQWVRNAGRNRERLQAAFGTAEGIEVDPRMLNVNFSVIPSSGRMNRPTDMSGANTVMQNLMQVPGVSEQIASLMPIQTLFYMWCERNGFHDIEEIAAGMQNARINVVPDQWAMEQEAAGNLVAAGQG